MVSVASGSSPGIVRPRLGFLGVGWIGLDRMRAILSTKRIEAVAIADPVPERIAAALELAPDATIASSLEAMLDQDLDGVVIATPSALHAAQAIAVLDRGAAVFCQKPLGRNCAETSAVIDAARRSDRLLGVDLSYRHMSAMRRIHALINSGDLGSLYAVDLVFHNAYGPGKPWFFDRALAGGGCVIDLGVHLVDLLLWLLGWPDVVRVESALFSKGARLRRGADEVEDYAVATLELSSGLVARIACSWHLNAGCDSIIAGEFHGTQAGACFRNVNGSFLDFTSDHNRGTARERLSSPPDAWPGRAAAAWATDLACANRYNVDNQNLVRVAEVLDRIYDC